MLGDSERCRIRGGGEMKSPDAPTAKKGFFVTHFLTVKDQVTHTITYWRRPTIACWFPSSTHLYFTCRAFCGFLDQSGDFLRMRNVHGVACACACDFDFVALGPCGIPAFKFWIDSAVVARHPHAAGSRTSRTGAPLRSSLSRVIGSSRTR